MIYLELELELELGLELWLELELGLVAPVAPVEKVVEEQLDQPDVAVLAVHLEEYLRNSCISTRIPRESKTKE